MKLVRFGEPNEERPGVLNREGNIIDVSSFVEDFTPQFLQENGIQSLSTWLKQYELSLPTYSPTQRFGSPIAHPGKIICIGLNYSDHAKESGSEVPKEPLIFSKAVTALNGPNDPIEIPQNSLKTDWEVELALVIGKRAKYVDENDALSYIAGYCIMNDVSEREFQKEHCGQWVKGKSHDTFAPLGPYLVTPDEIADVQNLDMYLDVNGIRMQTGNTRFMIFGVYFLVSYISRFMTLMPGDIISTGTPPGVGMGRKPEVYLKPGDVTELGVEGLGSQRQSVLAYSSNIS